MEVCDQSKTLEHSLSKQLHRLSELSETITLRLLELEERVSLLETKHNSHSESSVLAAQELLVDSEERVRHLKDLLGAASGDDSCSLELVDDPKAKVEENIDKEGDDGIDSDLLDLTFQSSVEFEENEILSQNELTQEYLEDDSEGSLMSA